MTCKSILEEVRHVSILDTIIPYPPQLPYSIGSKNVSTAVFDWQRQGRLMEGSEVGQFLSRIASPRWWAFHLIFDLSSMNNGQFWEVLMVRVKLTLTIILDYFIILHDTHFDCCFLIWIRLRSLGKTTPPWHADQVSMEGGPPSTMHFWALFNPPKTVPTFKFGDWDLKKILVQDDYSIQTLPKLFRKFSIIILHWLVFLWRWLWLSFPTPNARVRGPRASLVYGVPGQVWLWLIRY